MVDMNVRVACVVVVVIAVVCLVQPGLTQTLTLGSCPKPPVKADFDINRYAGTWYENRKNRRYFFIMDSGLRCATETYTIGDDQTITMTAKGVRIINGRNHEAKGYGKVQSPGKLSFNFDSVSFSPRDVPMWILDTDYDGYSVVWSCTERGGMNAQIAWILTRESQPDPSIVRTALEVLDRNGLARSSLMQTTQSNCNYDSIKKKSKWPFY